MHESNSEISIKYNQTTKKVEINTSKEVEINTSKEVEINTSKEVIKNDNNKLDIE
jgi:hypothetical protein